MRIAILLSLALLLPSPVAAQAAAPAPTAAPAQRQAARQGASARTGMALTVTDPTGATLPGVRVEVLGASDRSGNTDESGTLRFANMRAGTYRVRFSGDEVIAFEREVSVRAGQTAEVDVTLHPAERREEAPPPQPQAPAPAPVGPPGEPTVLDIPSFTERNLIRREPRRDSPIGCSGNARATLVQLNEPQAERLYDTAEAMYYVVAGAGTMLIQGRETQIAAGSFALIPRGTSFAISRRGRNPIVLLHVLSGEPCEP